MFIYCICLLIYFACNGGVVNAVYSFHECCVFSAIDKDKQKNVYICILYMCIIMV